MQFTNDPLLDLRRTFRRPSVGRPREASLLGLLRFDLQQFHATKGTAPAAVVAPLLAALGNCVGLELLAKYWSGGHDVPSSTVVDFLTSVGGLSQPDAEVLLQFRNSLAHGYGLGTRRRKDSKVFSFALDTGGTGSSPLISRRPANAYVINLPSLERLFDFATHQCRSAIARDPVRLGEIRIT